MIKIQTYVQAQTLEEAWQLNQKRSARILGGMLWLKMQDLNVSTAIDLCRLGLDAIEETDEQFTLGAMVTLRQIEQHAGLAAYTQGASVRAVRDIVGVQFRNMATLGGSLWSRFGFSDLLAWMLSMDSWVELYKGGLIPLEQFAAMPYDRDLLVRVIVRKTPGRFAYQAMRNQRTDIPVLNCAVSAESAQAFAAWAAGQVPTGSNSRGSAAYRTHLVKVLVRRALEEVGGITG